MRLLTNAALIAIVLLACIQGAASAQSRFEIVQDEDKLVVHIDGAIFSEYHYKKFAKPVLWPVLGPGGYAMTRAYPFAEKEGEKTDHIHQKSFWFTHGDVNGVDFWAEGEGKGTIRHREFREIGGGKQGVIALTNEWLGPDGAKLLEEATSLVFWAEENLRAIDVDTTLTATEGEVKFGDTKEGSFGVRVPTTMDVDSKLGGKITNSEGQTDAEAWGKAARWVDYSGPVGKSTLGITILNHPESFRFPAHWHVRTYGLFAANVFGLRDFTGDESVDGSHTLPKGESIRFRFRVLLHEGAADKEMIERHFERYSQDD